MKRKIFKSLSVSHSKEYCPTIQINKCSEKHLFNVDILGRAVHTKGSGSRFRSVFAVLLISSYKNYTKIFRLVEKLIVFEKIRDNKIPIAYQRLRNFVLSKYS